MYEVVLPASPRFCFSEFVDVRTARLWLPALKKARVVRSDAQGRPLEVSYEFGAALSYALVYAYDDDALSVRWVPSAGVQDGVSGSANFEPVREGCLFRYSAVSLRGRSPTHEQEVGMAFAHWIRGRAQNGTIT